MTREEIKSKIDNWSKAQEDFSILKSLIKERAIEIVEAKGIGFGKYANHVQNIEILSENKGSEIKIDNGYANWGEDYESLYVYLSLDELSMSDEEWKIYIDLLEEHTLEEQMIEKNKEEKEKERKEKEELERLKKKYPS